MGANRNEPYFFVILPLVLFARAIAVVVQLASFVTVWPLVWLVVRTLDMLKKATLMLLKRGQNENKLWYATLNKVDLNTLVLHKSGRLTDLPNWLAYTSNKGAQGATYRNFWNRLGTFSDLDPNLYLNRYSIITLLAVQVALATSIVPFLPKFGTLFFVPVVIAAGGLVAWAFSYTNNCKDIERTSSVNILYHPPKMLERGQTVLAIAPDNPVAINICTEICYVLLSFVSKLFLAVAFQYGIDSRETQGFIANTCQ